MSYIQPENSNRVNSIKQKFESPSEAGTSPEPKCIAQKTKESLCRTLSASPIAPRKNLKLNVTRQLSNPGRNIKRTPAFRGDKLSRTKNLNSPTKEKIVSLVDKNVKLFEDKPEYGKLGNVKKKHESTVDETAAVYDDVDSMILYNSRGSKDLRTKFNDNNGYGKLLTPKNGQHQDSRSQSLDRLNNKEPFAAKVNERKESVRTTVISRHKNISGASDLTESVGPLNHEELLKTDDAGSFKLDKFLKNGVEYTKVMKTKSFKQRSNENEHSVHNSEEEKELPDIREELSRRKYAPQIKSEQSFTAVESNLYRTRRNASKNLSEEDRFPQLFTNEDSGPGQSKLDFVPVIDIIMKDKRNNVSRESSLPVNKDNAFNTKLTDTLKAALKAPLPSGPPPKKPPRTFAHSPISNRSPVDDYEEVDGFWQKIKVPIVDPALDLPDSTREKIHSFLHDAGFKQFRKSMKNKIKITGNEATDDFSSHKISTRTTKPQDDFKEQDENLGALQKITSFDSRLCRIKELDNGSSKFRKSDENSTEYEPILVTDSNNCNISVSLAKLGIDSKEDGHNYSPVDSTSKLRESLSPIHPVTESTTSEDNRSVSPMNISYSPKKFKTSPMRSSSSGRLRSGKDSKEMLDKLEHVLTQHQKASGPKVIIPRTDKFEQLGITGQCETETRNEISRHKDIFQKRLSRTLEDSRKLGPLPNIPSLYAPDEPERGRNLAFDCLPSLNCAGNSSIYERIQNPDFKTYLTEGKSSCSLERSENIYTKSGVAAAAAAPKNSQFYLDNVTKDFLSPDPYDTSLISPASKRLSNELTTFSDAKKQITSLSKREEHVYAEPFDFNTNSSTDVTNLESATSSPRNHRRFLANKNKREESPKSFRKGAELHYMCTPIPTAYVETNNNHIENDITMMNNRQESDTAKKSLLKLAILSRPSPNKFDKTKIEQLLDQAFGQPVMAGSETPTDSNTSSDTDSWASTTSMSEETSTFSEKLQIFQDKEKSFHPTKAELHRSQTEKRKHYVRRVSSRFSDRKEGLAAHRLDHLFEVCLLVELNLSTRKPYVKDQYPIHAVTPAWIENFCFPDGLDWPPMESDQNLAYTFVLTDEKGNRRYGYCRRVKPEGAPVCLPLAYCLITKHRASGFYAKLLDELESRHGQPDITRRNFIEQLYYSTIPKPGEALRLKPQLNEAVNESINGEDGCTGNVVVNKFTNSYGKTYNSAAMTKPNTALLTSERSKTNHEEMSNDLKELEFSDNEYAILRLDDHRLDEKDMSQLFDAVSVKVLLILFASLLLERKVVLTCNKLSKLSSCVEALQNLLYPFSWPHPFIPFLPNIPEFSEILQAPSPFVIGILKQRNGFTIQVSQLEDGIVVDLDNSKVISAVGDESSILPSRLQKGLKSALQIVANSTKSGDGFRNFLVSEAFLRVFVETCAHCDSHIVTQQDGKTIFEKESFVKAAPSRNVQYFLEWFVETTMFNQFIQDRLLRVGLNMPSVDQMKLFDQRLAEYLMAADKNPQSKKSSNKKKTLGDRFKDLTNFNN